MPTKLCAKCGLKAPCAKSKLFPTLCYGCGMGPHTDAINRKSNDKRKKLKPNYHKEYYKKWKASRKPKP